MPGSKLYYTEFSKKIKEKHPEYKDVADDVLAKLMKMGIQGLLLMGNTSEPVCEIPVELNRIGVILYGGLNPVAAAAEAGFETENHGMSTVMNYQDLSEVEELSIKECR